MFILRIGAEALKISDNRLSTDIKHSAFGKFKTPRNSGIKQKYSTNNQSILYNLLKERHVPSSHLDPDVLVNVSSGPPTARPNSSNTELLKRSGIKSLSSRPSSAPQSVRFHPYAKHKPVLVNKFNDKHTVKVYPESLILQWLKNMVIIVKPEPRGDKTLWKILSLSDTDRKNILKQSWHLIFITYLVEFIQTNDDKMKSILGLLIKDYDKTFENGNYKKLSRLTRVFSNDLEGVIDQMIQLNLSQSLFQLFRVAILFTDRHGDKELKNMELLKPLLLCHSNEYYRRFDDVIENLFRLDVVMAESMFCGHLTQTIDNIIDELYSQS